VTHRPNHIETDAVKLGENEIGGITYTQAVNGVGKEDQDPAKAGAADMVSRTKLLAEFRAGLNLHPGQVKTTSTSTSTHRCFSLAAGV